MYAARINAAPSRPEGQDERRRADERTVRYTSCLPALCDRQFRAVATLRGRDGFNGQSHSDGDYTIAFGDWRQRVRFPPPPVEKPLFLGVFLCRPETVSYAPPNTS